jgi:hypothetical protein
MGSSEKFCLRWNSYESNISSSFRELREDSEFFDVTLCCDNGIDIVQAHKVILAACSPFFQKILSHQKSQQNPLLYLKGICLEDLQAALEFMYHGEVNLEQDSLNNFLSAAKELAIKGLSVDTKPISPNTASKKFISAKRKKILPQTPSSNPQIAKRQKTSQVLTPVENKEKIMDRKSKSKLQIEDVERIIAKNSKSPQDLAEAEKFEEIPQMSRVKNMIIKADATAKDTTKNHTADENMERSDWASDQTDFDNKNYNDGITNTVGYHGDFEDFEDENEFEDSLGFVEGPEDTMDQIETKGTNLWF